MNKNKGSRKNYNKISMSINRWVKNIGTRYMKLIRESRCENTCRKHQQHQQAKGIDNCEIMMETDSKFPPQKEPLCGDEVLHNHHHSLSRAGPDPVQSVLHNWASDFWGPQSFFFFAAVHSVHCYIIFVQKKVKSPKYLNTRLKDRPNTICLHVYKLTIILL
jgi:hypothetical protein